MEKEALHHEAAYSLASRQRLVRTRTLFFVLRHFTWFLVIGLFILLGGFQPTFLHPQTIAYIFYVSSLAGFLIYGQSVCLLTGNFDLSIARIAGISALIGALILTSWLPGVPGVLVVLFVLALGGALGFANGILVGRLGINSFLATLSTYLVYLYLAYFLVAAPIEGSALPPIYLWLGSAKAQVWGLSASFVVFLIVGLVLDLILRRTSLGVYIYATGADPVVSRALGINTANIIVAAYTIAGVLAGLAGLAFVGFTGSVTNSIAEGQEFWTFAGATIGGVSLRGGRGSIIDIVGGAVFIGLVTTGVLVFNIVPTLRMVIAGLIILASMLISRGRDLVEERLLKTLSDNP